MFLPRSRSFPIGGPSVAAAFLLPHLLPHLLFLLSAPAAAQQITIATTRSLDFGRFAAGRGGSVTVSPTGARSGGGGVVLLNSPGAGAAVFSIGNGIGGIGGTVGQAVAISLPPNGSIHLSSGANSMALGAFVSSSPLILTVPAGGLTLSVGATMTVAPNQPRGNYSGTFPLIVDFQ
jgi:hypothetical protein